MNIFEKIKERKAAKEAEIAEEARLAQVKEKCEKDFEAYKMFTMSNQTKIGTIEERYSEDGKNNVKTTIAYTEYGPIIKRVVHKESLENGYNIVDNHTTYEGYIKPTEEQELSGYFKLKNYKISVANPIERETRCFQNYEGTNRTVSEEINEFKDVQESYTQAGKYGDIVNTFENCIKNISEKIAAAQQEVQK